MSDQLLYRGRFAPTPSGPLHFGSLIAAVASYLQAKHHQGIWLIRIDDIDPPREVKGAADNILKTLESFGFEWDEKILYQSQRLERYKDAINDLDSLNLTYPCSCSRTSILKQTGQQKGELIYPGFCRNGPIDKNKQHEYSIRLRCEQTPVTFTDALQGKQIFDLEKHSGDFILQRRDQLFSYHFATGIDDADQGITEVVRGCDLLYSTPNQIRVQQVLQLAQPHYCHLPVAVNNAGQKLSKQNHAKPIRKKDSAILLYKTLKFLGQLPPIHLMQSNQEDIWCWAKEHWQLNLVPKENSKINSIKLN